ncbi:reticulocyte-binding protein homolog 1-like isoform X1 [Onthophagus taurus]|uniref:reticulocyte-binding protein homolog 1-like isoform X1 n=2 Tax=Onthophagus taurus TaxID=166361 RepID=UPI0039BECB81
MEKENPDLNKELPNNYKEIVANEQNEMTQVVAAQITDSKKDAGNEELKQYLMPWLHLVDSNGELPSNYEEILATEQKQKAEAIKYEEQKESDSEKKARYEALVKQCHMPWLHLIDGVTGELPKNYKQILAEEEMQKGNKDQNNDSKPAGQTMVDLNNSSKLSHLKSDKKIIKLFKKPPVTTTSKSNSKSFLFKTPKVSNCSTKFASKNKKPSTTSNKDTTKLITNKKQDVRIKPLIKIESPPLQIESHSRRQLFASTPRTQQEISPKSPSPLADSILNTTANFVELEALLQTPKVDKFNTLQKLEAYINETEKSIKRQMDTLNELKEVYKSLKNGSVLKDCNKKKNLNLRVAVLKSTIDVNEKENTNYKAVNRYNNLKADIDLLKTPNYAVVNDMRNRLSKKVMNQCVMLEDTPKK